MAARPEGGSWLGVCAAIVILTVLCETLGVWASGSSSAQASAWLRNRIARHVLGVGPAITRRFPEETWSPGWA